MSFILLLAATIICPAPTQSALTGLWESTARSRGGIGHTLEFRTDGTFVEAATVMVDLRYRFDHQKLWAFEDGTTPSADDSVSVKITGSRLVETAADGSRVEKHRLDTAQTEGNTLAGAWTYRHYTGAMAFERYTADGQLLFRLPMSSSVGCFVPLERQLTLAVPNQPEGSYTYEIQQTELVLTGPDGEMRRYRKSSYGAWYDREHIDYKPPK